MSIKSIKVYFSDIFDVSEEKIEEYGALNISLINDMPLFIDPFLLFNSDKPKYQELHEVIIKYISFLRDEAINISYDLNAKLKELYSFKEVKQNWLGFSFSGNNGKALGPKFAQNLHNNLQSIFKNFDDVDISESPHLEKLCLISKEVGRDKVSDFTVNLIKEYLLVYTERFAKNFLTDDKCDNFQINRTRFNYNTRSWVTSNYYLPSFNGDYVILTPKDMLTKDETFINRSDMLNTLYDIAPALEDNQLRYRINDYFINILQNKKNGKGLTKKEKQKAASALIAENPEIIDHYIKHKEGKGDFAVSYSKAAVKETENIYIDNTKALINLLLEKSEFYNIKWRNTYNDALDGARYLKHVIEDNDGYRMFYHKGQPINREDIGKIMFRLIWRGSIYSIDSEVNNGRGQADYKISFGDIDKTIVELKLASNSKLKNNLAKQVEIYKKANNTKQEIKVILFFTKEQYNKVIKIFNELQLNNKENIILIDARNDNKPSASNVKIREV